MLFSTLVKTLRKVVEEALETGEGGEEAWKTLIEDTTIDSESEWREIYHSEIPSILRDSLRKLGLDCRLFHKKDDVPGFEYVANCVTREGRRIALGFDVDYDYEIGEVVLSFIKAYRDSEWAPTQLTHYHEV